jgi:hypothetical protein
VRLCALFGELNFAYLVNIMNHKSNVEVSTALYPFFGMLRFHLNKTTMVMALIADLNTFWT